MTVSTSTAPATTETSQRNTTEHQLYVVADYTSLSTWYTTQPG